MKQFIVSRDHIDTGRMYKTTTFNCVLINDELKIRYSAPYYIQYLDEGRFVNDFLNIPLVTDTIATFIAFQVELSL